MTAQPVFSRTLKRFFATGFSLGLALSAATADVITDWNATLETALRNPSLPPDFSGRAMAIVHVAVFDAVNGIEKRYSPLRVITPAPLEARAEAAAAQAAYTTLVAIFPAQTALFDAQLEKSLAQISPGSSNAASVTAGRSWGETVAHQILTWRATDGFTTEVTYPGSTAAGHWRHAPNTNGFAAALSMTVTTPFSLKDPAALDPGAPYGFSDRNALLASSAYAADVNEVRARGGVTSTTRTQAEADLALLINLVDPVDINALVRRSLPTSTKLVDNARTFALLNIACHDGNIVVMQTKYKYGLWRPVQAINYADEDGNPATTADATWQPLLPTHPHPEWLGGHVCDTTAMLGVASHILGEDTKFTLSTSNPGAPAIAPAFTSFNQLSDAIIEARINIGFHYRTNGVVSQKVGYAIADQIVRGALLPMPGSGVINLALRGRTGAGADTLIAGFVVGAGSRRVLIRGVGPSLAVHGVPGFVADPKLIVYDGAGRMIAENDNWSSGNAVATTALTAAGSKAGAFPLGATSLDAAVLTTLTPGSYTIHLTGAGGVALIEAYEVP